MFVLTALMSFSAHAVQVRIATYNVYFGVGEPGTTEYLATRNVIQRVNPDVIAFQELLTTDYENWVTMAADLEYPYLAFGFSSGPLTGSHRLGFMSRYPILSAAEVTEYPGATELTRYPLRVVLQVPGALNPLVVYTVHNKAISGSVNEFRRAIEGRRTLSNMMAYVASNPLDTEFAILGDFNQNAGEAQTEQFDSLPSGLPSSYDLGSDVVFPVPYRYFPADRFAPGGLVPIHPFQEDTMIDITYETGARFDYILFSEDIRKSAYGAPVGEIYNSTRDDGTGGLPKFGSPLPSTTSATASDHYLVFSDFHMIDALPCVNPVLLLSEIASPASPGTRYVELYNSGVNSLSLTGYSLVVYFNGSSPVTMPLGETLAGGGTYLIAADVSSFLSTYGKIANQENTNLLHLDGNDVVAVLNPANQISDRYGVIGEPSATNDFSMTWAFTNRSVYRLAGISDPYPSWISSEWSSTNASFATPGTHTACDQASVYYNSLSLEPSAPQTGQAVVVSVEIARNLPASNLVPTAYYRVNNGVYQSLPLILTSNNTWKTMSFDPGASPSDEFNYYVITSLTGPGATDVVSYTNMYQYPHPQVVLDQLLPLFNEIGADDASTDDREFIEIIGPAGLNLAGYFIIHYNGFETSDADIWRYVFPSFVIPNDGITDANGVALGFCVIVTNGNMLVANADLKGMPGNLQNGPDGLVLYDPASNIVDAIAWGGAGDLATDDPGTVVVSGATTANNFLHVMLNDTASDSTLQAPDNVLGDSGSGWKIMTETPGAKNGGQTSGQIGIGTSLQVDSDGDSVSDDLDNCPELANPTQSDLDYDGIGDVCDSDRDNDGLLNANDNCPASPNPDQADLDNDGEGDACDFDIDGDGVENDEDNCFDHANPDQADIDDDGVGDVCDEDLDGDGVPNAADNCPQNFNPLQTDLDHDDIGDDCDGDVDGDGVSNALDNCPMLANPGQEDVNHDGFGDVCETDTDLDGVYDIIDNCVSVANPLQIDGDADGLGDACDTCTGTPGHTNMINQHFESASTPAGWSIVTTGRPDATWRFNDPVFRGNLTGSTGNFAIAESSLYSSSTQMATQLRTPKIDLRQVTAAELSFSTAYNYNTTRSNEVADVDVSINGTNGPWVNVWRGTTQDITGRITVNLSFAVGASNVMIRFHYYNAYRELYWQVDAVTLSCVTCTPVSDADGDGVGDVVDNCPLLFNPNQSDIDHDQVGDACDPDRDGDAMSDADEIVANTNSSDPNSFLRLSVIDIGSPVQILFPSSTGRIYSLQYNDHIITGHWYNVEGQSNLPGTGTMQTMMDSNSPVVRYYRVNVTLPTN